MEGERKEGKKGERKGRRRKRSWGKRRLRCFQTGQGQMFQVVTPGSVYICPGKKELKVCMRVLYYFSLIF